MVRTGKRRGGERDSGRVLAVKFKAVKHGNHGQAYALLASTIDDVERKRHKRNPFDDKYIKLCLSSFQESLPGKREENAVEDREHVESAAANVHVRVELIRTMKQNLVRQTADAAKQVADIEKQESTPKNTKRGRKNQRKPAVNLGESRANAREEGMDMIALEAAKLGYQEYLQLRSSMIEIEIPDPEDDPNTLDDEQLCFDPKTECRPQNFEEFVKSLFPENHEEELYEENPETGDAEDFDIRPFIQSVAEQWEPDPIEDPLISKEEIERFPNLWREFDWASVCPQESASQGGKDGSSLECDPQEGKFSGFSEGDGGDVPDPIETDCRVQGKCLESGSDVPEPENTPLPKKESIQENSQKTGSIDEGVDGGGNDMEQSSKSISHVTRREPEKSSLSTREVKEGPVDPLEVPSCEVLMEENGICFPSKRQDSIITREHDFEKGYVSNPNDLATACIKTPSPAEGAKKSTYHRTIDNSSKSKARKGFGGLDLVPCQREQVVQSDWISEDGFLEEVTKDRPDVFIKPDFSEGNLWNMRPDVLFRNPRTKLKYRPVYGPEALCIPPPKPRAQPEAGVGSGGCAFWGDEKGCCKFSAGSVDFRKGLFWDLDIVAFGEGRAEVDESTRTDTQDQEMVSNSDVECDLFFWEESPRSQENMKESHMDGSLPSRENCDENEPHQTTMQVDHYLSDTMLLEDTPSPQPNCSLHSLPKGRSICKPVLDTNPDSSRKGLRSAITLMDEVFEDSVSNSVLGTDQMKGRGSHDMVVDQDESCMEIPSEVNIVRCSILEKGVESDDDDFLLPPCHILFEHTQIEDPVLQAGKELPLDYESVLETQDIQGTVVGGGRKSWECDSISSVQVSDCDVVMDVENEQSDYQALDASSWEPYNSISQILSKGAEIKRSKAPSIKVTNQGDYGEIEELEIGADGNGTQPDIEESEILMCDASLAGNDLGNDDVMDGCGGDGCVQGEVGQGISEQQASPTIDLMETESLEASRDTLGSCGNQVDEEMNGKPDGSVSNLFDWEECDPEPLQGERGEPIVKTHSPTQQYDNILGNSQSREGPSCFPFSTAVAQSVLKTKPSKPSNDKFAVESITTRTSARPKKRMRDELCDQMIKEALKEDAKSRLDLRPLMSAVIKALFENNSSGSSSFDRLLATLRGPIQGEKSTTNLNPQRLLFALLHVAHQNNNRKDSGSLFTGHVRLERNNTSNDINIFTH